MTLPFQPEALLTVFLASLRVGVVLMFLPVLGGEFLPPLIRVFLAFAIGFVIAPPNPGELPLDGMGLLQAVAWEFVIGASIGFFCRMLLIAPTISGDMIAQELGVRIAQEIDPNTRVPSTPVGRLYETIFLLMFLLMNGHHDIFRALHRSFRTLPIGAGSMPVGTQEITHWLSVCLRHALMIAVPLFAVLLVLSFVLALLSKSVPQINILNFGFASRLLGGFLAAVVLFPFIQRPVVALMDSLKEGLYHMVGG